MTDRCAGCENELPTAARWCGSCGAAVPRGTEPSAPDPVRDREDAGPELVGEPTGGLATVEVLDREDAPAEASDTAVRRSPAALVRRVAAAAVAVAVVAGMLATGEGSDPAGASSVGGDAAGSGWISATAPDPLPTEVAWTAETLPGADPWTDVESTGAHVVAHTESWVWVRDGGTGDVLWMAPRSGSAAVTNGVLIELSDADGAVARDLDTGRVRWRRTEAEGLEVIDQGLGSIAVWSQGALELIDAPLGDTRARLDLTGQRGPAYGLGPGDVRSVETDDGWLFAWVASEDEPDPLLVAFERDRLRPRWVVPVGGIGRVETAGEMTSIATFGRAYVLDPGGELVHIATVDPSHSHALTGSAGSWTFLRSAPRGVWLLRSNGSTGELFAATGDQIVQEVTTEGGLATITVTDSTGELRTTIDVETGEVVHPLRPRESTPAVGGFGVHGTEDLEVVGRDLRRLIDGGVVWSHPVLSSPGGGLRVDGEDLVLSTPLGPQVRSVADGSLRWEAEHPAVEGEWAARPWPRGSAPVLTDDLVIAAGGSPRRGAEPLTAYDRRTGVVAWREDDPGGRTTLDLTLLDGTVFGSTEGEVRAFDVRTGARRFARNVRHGHHHGAIAASEHALVAGPSAFERGSRSRDLQVEAFDAMNGERSWEAPAGSICTSPVIARPPGAPPLALWGTRTGLHAHDLADGTARWTTERTGAICRELALVEEDRLVVVVGAYDTPEADDVDALLGTHPLTALRLADRTVAWRADLGSPIVTDPVVAGDQVLVGLADGHIVAIDGGTGETVSTTRVDGVPATAPALADDGTLLVLLTDGRLAALR